MEDNKFNATVEALFRGMDSVVSSKTVVGDAIHIGDTIILPLVDVSFAVVFLVAVMASILQNPVPNI